MKLIKMLDSQTFYVPEIINNTTNSNEQDVIFEKSTKCPRIFNRREMKIMKSVSHKIKEHFLLANGFSLIYSF